MMLLKNDKCEIEVEIDEQYGIESPDNRLYDFNDQYYEIDYNGNLIE